MSPSHRGAMSAKPYWVSNPVVAQDAALLSIRMLHSLALGYKILEVAKARSWDDLGGEIPTEMRLTSTQSASVVEFEFLCQMQLAKSGDRPKVSVMVCTVCSRWTLTATGVTRSAKCQLSVACTGKLLSPPRIAKCDDKPEDLDPTWRPPAPPPPTVDPDLPVQQQPASTTEHGAQQPSPPAPESDDFWPFDNEIPDWIAAGHTG